MARSLLLAAASAVSAALLAGAPAAAQARPSDGAQRPTPAASSDAWLDADARLLHGAAVAARDRLDRGVLAYTAVVKQRVAASLRTPLRDRTLYRAESASRVFWDRDGETVIQVLASRQQTPAGVVEPDARGAVWDQVFDPSGDRLLFGLDGDGDEGGSGDGDAFVVHPLGPEALGGYRFSTGDTLTLSLPDGRRLRAVELRIHPRSADPRLLQGTLWIEPATGALVRAVYRLSRPLDVERDTDELDGEEDMDKVPGLLKPFTFDLTMVAVDYALWDGEHWLPRSLRAEGVVGAGILKAPATMEVAYTLESVVTETSLAREEAAADAPDAVETRHFATRSEAMAWLAERTEGVGYRADEGWSRSRGRRIHYVVPRDPAVLATSPHLPPPVWEDAPAFASSHELEALGRTLADLPLPSPEGIPTTFYWGPQRPDLMRYNRVEGLSVAARLSALVGGGLGPLSVDLLGRLGHADLEPRGSLAVTRETLRRRVTVEAYHELRSLEEGSRHLQLGNSATALLFGRDDGDYMQATGAQVVLTPPTARRPWARLRLYGEHQHGVATNTDASLASLVDGDRTFRPVRPVTPLDQAGASLLLAPWWGTDPTLPQGGVEAWGQAETGDARFARARTTLRGVLPVAAGARLGAELSGGTTWGEAPPQRAWLMGGAASLRGYAPATLVGPDYARARLEVSRVFPVMALTLFGDAAWAGRWDGFDADDALASVGVGLSIVDGLIRLDLARGLRDPRGTRLDLYLDGIL